MRRQAGITMKKRKKKLIIWLSVVAAVVVAFGLAIVSVWYIDNRRASFEREYTLFVYPEMGAQEVLDSLSCGAGALSVRSLERCAERENLAARIKPGKYIVKPEHTSIYVMRMICNNWQSPHKLTLSGTIRTKAAVARKISSQMMVDSASVACCLTDTAFLANFGFTPENVFALILPDTYEMWWTASVSDIFSRLKKEYDRFWTPERLDQASALKMTPMQVSVMASIVSGETLKSFEYPVIAGVYLNRYRKGMKLQADPTIAFCYDYTLDRILKQHLSIDSPYNTYKYAGLPPAPICSPSKACIDAVLNAEKHDYIYFCASPAFDGTHRFAHSYSKHLQNAREFHRALTARRRAQAAGK